MCIRDSSKAGTEEAKRTVSKIAKLMVLKSELDAQSAALHDINPVYHEAQYDEQLVASWVPDNATPTVPKIILDTVLAVPLGDDPGTVVASGPAEATVAGEQDRTDAEVEAAKQARFISAFEPQKSDLNEQDSGTAEVVALLNQLESLDRAAKRSVAAEVESSIEAGACLVDDLGRARILEICRSVREQCRRFDMPETKAKLQREMQQAVLGAASWEPDAASS